MTPEEQACWDRLAAENAALNARLAEAEALLREARERMSKAETTARVLTGQLPEYSEGQQMLRSLATNMGDSVKRIGAYFASDSAPAIIESEITPDNSHLCGADRISAGLREAGYTRRDTRLQCDECGKWFTPQLLPAHQCAADQPGETGK